MKEETKDTKYESMILEISRICNHYSLDSRSDTPNYMLAEYMLGCLTVYENTIRNRTNWLNDK